MLCVVWYCLWSVVVGVVPVFVARCVVFVFVVVCRLSLLVVCCVASWIVGGCVSPLFFVVGYC